MVIKLTPTFHRNGPTAKEVSRWRDEIHALVSAPTLLSLVRRRLPLVSWLPNYDPKNLIWDGIAGITVGLTIIPQSIVFASVANVPLQYGLYASIMGCFVYCLFGTVREMSIGPSAVMGLLIAKYSARGGPDYTVLLCFLSGCIELLFSLLNLGFLIDFISAPVNCGFSTAAAVMITATQLRTVLGLNFIEADSFFDGLEKIYRNIDRINAWDLLLGISCMVFLLLLRYVNTLEWMDPGPFPTNLQIFTRWVVRFACTGRNALVVVVSATTAYFLLGHDVHVLTLTGDVKEGLPDFHSPPFAVQRTNGTEGFVDMIEDLGAGLFLVPVLSILQHLVVAKVFVGGKSLDASQEIFALGLTNVLGSFINGLPTTGNFPRSALNANNGVRSPLGGVFTGCLVLLALEFLTSYFKFIPRATLASIIISSVIFMFKYDIILHLWKTKKIDLLVMMVTSLGCIGLGADYGILVGIGLSLAVLLYSTARPNINVQVSKCQPQFILVQPDRMLTFPAVEYVRYKVCKVSDEQRHLPIIFDGSHLCGMDFTIAQCVKELSEEFKNRNQTLIFTNLQNHVTNVIKGLQPSNFLYYPTKAEAEAALEEGREKPLPPPTTISRAASSSEDRVKVHRIDLRTLGSDCSHPSEYAAAWLNVTNVLVSIPRVRLIRDCAPPTPPNGLTL